MLKLGKTKNKLANVFEAHCVDSWVLADMVWCMQSKPENKQMLLVSPIQVFRRQLHRLQPAKGGVRKPHGGTNSCGFKKGSTVWHPTHGFTYIGGSMENRVSLHSIKTGGRVTQDAKPNDIELLTNTSWRVRLLPRINTVASKNRKSV